MKQALPVLFGALMAISFSSCERHDWSETRELHLQHNEDHAEHEHEEAPIEHEPHGENDSEEVE